MIQSGSLNNNVTDTLWNFVYWDAEIGEVVYGR